MISYSVMALHIWFKLPTTCFRLTFAINCIAGPGAMNAPAGVTEADMRTFVQDELESDLAHILTENGVPLAVQYNMGQNFKSVRRFSSIADSRADVRTMLRDAYQISEDTLPRRAAVAAVVWPGKLRKSLRRRMCSCGQRRSCLESTGQLLRQTEQR